MHRGRYGRAVPLDHGDHRRRCGSTAPPSPHRAPPPPGHDRPLPPAHPAAVSAAAGGAPCRDAVWCLVACCRCGLRRRGRCAVLGRCVVPADAPLSGPHRGSARRRTAVPPGEPCRVGGLYCAAPAGRVAARVAPRREIVLRRLGQSCRGAPAWRCPWRAVPPSVGRAASCRVPCRVAPVSRVAWGSASPRPAASPRALRHPGKPRCLGQCVSSGRAAGPAAPHGSRPARQPRRPGAPPRRAAPPGQPPRPASRTAGISRATPGAGLPTGPR